MEFLTIFLSSLLTIISPAGFIIDSTVENSLRSRSASLSARSQIESVEQLEVRIDNTPSYQILQGKIERVRIASRGVYLIPNLRIDTLELETDYLNLDLKHLQQNEQGTINQFLRQPLQGGLRLVLTQKDINQALQSPEVIEILQQFINHLIPRSSQTLGKNYELVNLNLKLLNSNRLRLQGQLRKEGRESKSLDIMLESGIKVLAGHRIQLIEPVGSVNNRTLSAKLLKGFASGLSKRLDLKKLANNGIILRLLQLEIAEDDIKLAMFVRLENLKAEAINE